MFNRNEIGDPTAKPTTLRRHWRDLEEYQPNGGMWITPSSSERERLIRASSELMADPGAFRSAMRRALTEWPNSVAAAMTTPGLNRRAWIGRAGCYLATGSPEETTRLGWHDLDAAEQWAANDAADSVIAEWCATNRPSGETGQLAWEMFDA